MLTVSLLTSMLMATPASAVSLFTDGFESGTMGNWNKSTGITVQQTEVHAGASAARATAANTSSWAWKALGSAQTQVFFRAWIKVISQSTSHILLRVRAGGGSIIASVGVNSSDRLYRRNDVSGTTTTSATVVSRGAWHELQMRVLVNGTSSETEVWLDGSRISQLSGTLSLGTSPIGRVQIGDNASSRTSDTVFDDVVADTAFIGPEDTTPPSTPTGLAASAPASNRVELSWNRPPQSDTAGYTLYRDGAHLADVTGADTTTYDDTTVSPNATYSYTVDAVDTASNHSAQSAPATVTTPAVGSDPVVAAAGDIACDPASGAFNGGNGTATKCHMSQTAAVLQNLVSTTNLQAILPLGDTQYECGGPQAYAQSYGPSWGQAQLKAVTRPVIGEQEYLTTGGTDCTTTPGGGYFGYFGAAAGDPAKGYYSFDVGAWHLIALNSECPRVGGCAFGSAQHSFLQTDLAAHSSACTLAYWHHPRFSSSSGGGSSKVAAFWDLLYSAGADIVLGGNQHVYERFAPQTPTQEPSSNGIRSFTVGTGGKSHGQFFTIQPNSEVRDNTTYGVLKLTLHPTSYDWQFVPEAGGTFTDSGSGSCH